MPRFSRPPEPLSNELSANRLSGRMPLLFDDRPARCAETRAPLTHFVRVARPESSKGVALGLKLPRPSPSLRACHPTTYGGPRTWRTALGGASCGECLSQGERLQHSSPAPHHHRRAADHGQNYRAWFWHRDQKSSDEINIAIGHV